MVHSKGRPFIARNGHLVFLVFASFCHLFLLSNWWKYPRSSMIFYHSFIKIGSVFKSKFLKHHGRAACLITRGLSFSLAILHATITVICSFASFSPLHSPPFSTKLLFGSAPKKERCRHNLTHPWVHSLYFFIRVSL